MNIRPNTAILPFRRDSATSATPLIPSLDPAGYGYVTPHFPGGDTVKEALDELFRLSAPPGPEYKLFRVNPGNGRLDETFVVPDGVSELLVLLINGGGNGAVGKAGSGGEAWSFYGSVSPGQEISVTLRSSSSNGGNIANASAAFGGYGAYGEIVPVENRLFNSVAGSGYNYGKTYGAGGGGFWVESETQSPLPEMADVIAEQWLGLALTSTPDGKPSDASGTTPGRCWPDDSCTGGAPTDTSGGRGGAYGGGGGNMRTSGNVGYAGRGGHPFIAVFWGKKIRPAGTESIPAVVIPAA